MQPACRILQDPDLLLGESAQYWLTAALPLGCELSRSLTAVCWLACRMQQDEDAGMGVTYATDMLSRQLGCFSGAQTAADVW
jgi:hypothetical protein